MPIPDKPQDYAARLKATALRNSRSLASRAHHRQSGHPDQPLRDAGATTDHQQQRSSGGCPAVPVKVIAARFDSQPGVAPERRQGFEPPFESGKQGQFERRYIETLSDQALCILHSVHDRLFLADVVRAGGETLW